MATTKQTAANGVMVKWVLGLLAAAIIGGIGWMTAWGEQSADVVHHERRLTVIESTQLEDGRAISGLKTETKAMEKWLTRIELKLDSALRRHHPR